MPPFWEIWPRKLRFSGWGGPSEISAGLGLEPHLGTHYGRLGCRTACREGHWAQTLYDTTQARSCAEATQYRPAAERSGYGSRGVSVHAVPTLPGRRANLVTYRSATLNH